MNRKNALVALGAGGPVLLSGRTAVAQTPAAQPAAIRQALVLSGGGALGAYEAGVIQALAAAAGVREGEPLRPYGLVCGTSIGAFNGYLVATAQYAKLQELWGTIATHQVVRLKPEYAKIANPSSGVLTRLLEQLSLLSGMLTNVTGAFDGNYLRAWLLQYIDFDRPVVVPFIWAVTNLSTQRPEYFYLPRPDQNPQAVALGLSSMRLALGPRTVVRQASRELLVDQLRASAAVPVAFDPIPLPQADGTSGRYVDGGVTANTPIRVTTAIAQRVDTVLLDPPYKEVPLNSALQVSTASFATVQSRLMETEIRGVYFESFALQALADLPPSYSATFAQQAGISLEELRAIRSTLRQTQLYVLRPQAALPIKVLGFDDADSVAKTYDIGLTDGAAGFAPFDPSQGR